MANGFIGLKMKLLLLRDFINDTIVCTTATKIQPFIIDIALGAVKLKLKVSQELN